MEQTKRKFEYRWVIIAVCFLIEFAVLGYCSSNKGLYIGAIADANFGGDRFLLSFNDTLRYLISSLVNFFFGTLIIKLGARKMTALGFLSLIAAFLCYAYADTLLLFYIGGAFLGMGLALTTSAMVSFVIRNWVTTNTGSVLGFVMAANGLGSALSAQIVTPLIESGTYGYRNAYKLSVLVLIIVGIISVIFLREKPKGSTAVVPAKHKKRPSGDWEGLEFSDAIKRPYFIPACIGIFLTGMILSGINGVAPAMLKDDIGLNPGYVATVVTVHSLALMFFKFLTGVIFDRKGLRWMLTICQAAAIVVYICLAKVDNSPAGMALAMFYGIFSSLALPMETIGVSLVTGDLFGNKPFNRMLGLMTALNHLGYAVGCPVMNLGWKLSGGTYVPVILGGAALMVLVLIGYQFLITAAHKDRKSVKTQS